MKRAAAILAALFVCGAAPSRAGAVPMSIFVVSDTNGLCRQISDVTNMLADVNLLYRQAATVFVPVRFEIVPSNDWARVERDAAGARPLMRTICDYARGTGGVECYFVRHIDGAAGANTKRGLVLGENANARTWAHELGHAFGFPDIYDVYDGVALSVTGGVSRIRMPQDWGSATDEGFYPRGLQQADLVKRLLMYGYTSQTKADIPYGAVYGLWYEWIRDSTLPLGWRRDWRLGLAPIGFFSGGTRTAIHE